jgi:hypothetical protein
MEETQQLLLALRRELNAAKGEWGHLTDSEKALMRVLDALDARLTALEEESRHNRTLMLEGNGTL